MINAQKSRIFILLMICFCTLDIFAELPRKVLSIYGGYTLDADTIDQTCRDYIEPAFDAGFNMIEFKILVNGKVDRNDSEQMRRLRELCEAVESRGMKLMCYTYADPWNGKRFPMKDKQLPAFVSEDGEVVEDKFPLIHWNVFEKLMYNAFELAQISNHLPIEAVKVDLESMHNLGISYDDISWGKYAGFNDLDKNISIKQRFELLEEKNLEQDYVRWYQGQMELIASKFEVKMHQINPQLTLGFMPAHEGWFYEAFIKKLSTSQKPAVMDSWVLYNVSGFSDEVLEDQNFVKELNQHNIYVPWFRINNYYPEDIDVQAYHTAMNCDGYSAWTLTMLKKAQDELVNYHKLPQAATPEQYWQGFKKANEAVRSDLNSEKKEHDTIAFRKGRSVAPPILGLEDIKPPNLEPLGGKGQPQTISLRDQQIFDIFVKAGEEIKIDVRHLAGSQRAVALHYALIDSRQRLLRHETISPAAEESISVTAPSTGSYSFVITGGEAGMAWYSVKIYNPDHGLRLPAYIFFRQDTELWLKRKSLDSKAAVTIRTNQNQLIAARLNDSSQFCGDDKNPVTIELENTMDMQKLLLAEPDQIPQGKYVQDFLISVQGEVEPYLYSSPQGGIILND